MSNIQHAALTGAELHESKGVASATSNKVYVTDGAGSGTWQKIASGQIDTTSIFTTNIRYLSGSFVDISAPDTIYLPVPFAGTATEVTVTLKNAITIANSIVTVKNNAGTSMAATLTIAFTGSAAGTTFTATLSTNNTFTAGQSIQINTDGGSSTTCIANVTIKFTQTA